MKKRSRRIGLLIGLCMATLLLGSKEVNAQTTATEEPKKISDLSKAYRVILDGATKEFIAGYMIDEAFLMWIHATYGDEAINALASYVLDGQTQAEMWYDVTGESIHVLWLKFCQATGFQSYQLENVCFKECADDKNAVISFTGDINFARDWCTTEYMKTKPNGIYDCFSKELLEIAQQSDVMVMNNEFTYTDHEKPLWGKDYVFRAEPKQVDLLSVFGADMVTLANNHVFDYGEKGLSDTLTHLKDKGILYLGAGENMKEASKIQYFVLNGRKIAMVSATEIERSLKYTREATDSENGVLKTLNPEKFVSVISEAKKHSDFVIAVVHWGTEGALYPDNSQRYLAERFVDAGADVIIGGHPHRLQGASYVKQVPVAYSLGNFWFSDGALYTTIAQVIVADDGSLRLKYLPCVQKELTTSLITDEVEKEEFYRYLAAVSFDVWIDHAGNVYDKYDGADINVQSMLDADTCTTNIKGYMDNEGNAIDIVGNLKY